MIASAKAAKAALSVLLLFTSATSTPTQTIDSELVGTVVELHGQWTITNHKRFLRAGQGVPSGSVLRPESVESDTSISIALLNGKYIGIRCDNISSAACTAGLQMPAAYLGNAGVREIVETVMKVLFDSSPKGRGFFSPTIIRAVASAGKKELIVPYQAGEPTELDASVLSALTPSAYTVELAKLDDNGDVLPLTSTRWNSNGDKPLLTLPSPGLYSVRFRNEYRDVALDLALLAAPPAQYQALKASFDGARGLCAKWNGPGAEKSSNAFLRAYLTALAARHEAR